MRKLRWLLLGLAIVAGLGVAVISLFFPEFWGLLATDEQRKLKPPSSASAARPTERTLLLFALDGVNRSLLYDMLHQGELPVLASLLGSEGETFPHAHFDDRLLSTLPSSTLAAWATVFTGVPPAQHGVTGNEFFIREKRLFAAPAPVSIIDPEPVIETYTKGYANALLAAPTVYELLRERRPSLSSWVSMSQFYRGATRLLLADRTVVADAFRALLSDTLGSAEPTGIYAELDEEVIDTLCDTLERDPAPHVITVYLTGTDHFAHGSEKGPDVARRQYLREVVDPELARLKRELEKRDALRERYVVITSDHGHTQVLHDDRHALSTDLENDPPAVLRSAGFRLRPFELHVEDDAPFQSVLAYGGAMAYVYLADRSTCVAETAVCDWTRPPRFEEDVLVAAEAFHRANETGHAAPKLRGTIDLILTRRPRPFAEDDLPFEVYLGQGKLEPLGRYLQAHPRPTYVAFEPRLRDLAAGRYGERAGDILLLAHSGDVDTAQERYYFAGLYHSWHGSPSRRDSEVPLIVAHPGRTTAELRAQTTRAVPRGRQQELTPLLLELLAPDGG